MCTVHFKKPEERIHAGSFHHEEMIGISGDKCKWKNRKQHNETKCVLARETYNPGVSIF
jgi:hypothetical protein